MKLQKLILHANGENAGTYGPLCFAENFTGDLSEKVARFFNWDDNHVVEVDRYRVVEVELPDWMNEAQYLANYIHLRYAREFGFDVANMTETEWRNYDRLPSEQWRYFVPWLLKKKSKNAFIVSLQEQVREWLARPVSEQKFPVPLSPKQFEAAARWCPLYEAKQIAAYVYRNRGLY